MCLSGIVLEIQHFDNVEVTDLTFQGHSRSKVMVPNESPYMTSYSCLIVTMGLSGIVSEIQHFENIEATDLTF